MHFVYILKCSDGRFYTACTSNLRKRIIMHHKGLISSTRKRRPVALITHFRFRKKSNAYEFVRSLKGGTGMAFVRNGNE